MYYKNNVPVPFEHFPPSAVELLDNFSLINDVFEVDHVFSQDEDFGFHRKLVLNVLPADQVTIADEIGIYCKVSALSGEPALFLRKESAGEIIDFTTCDTNTDRITHTRLPSGLIIETGIPVTQCAPGINTTFLFRTDAGVKQFTAVYGVQISVAQSVDVINTIVHLISFNATGFVVRNSSSTSMAGISYFAYGV